LALLPITPLPRLAAALYPCYVELLSVKFGYFSISCLSKDDVAIMPLTLFALADCC